MIAIENTRLLNELRQRTDDLGESLEQQTATSEVLKVISSSPGELRPVFQAMLENATRICNAKFANLLLYEEKAFRMAAMHGGSAEWIEFRTRNPLVHPTGKNPLGRLVRTKRLQHIADTWTDPAYVAREPSFVPMVEIGGARTVLVVPMLKDDELIGAINIYNREVRPFTDKQIELVQNFAAQAVIAIENTRLLNELRQRTDDLSESLEQQTATADVLKVISSSPGELEPVFQAMLENATHICEAHFGCMFGYESGTFRPMALRNVPEAHASFITQRGPFQALPGSILDRILQTNDVASFDDDAAGTSPSSASRLGGARSTIGVPMLKNNVLIGAIVIYRQEVRPFTGKQVELVRNFAAQAVIAIENARLLNELRQRTDDLSEALEQQTATSEVLKVISSSPGSLDPVFQAMLKNAVNICNARFGALWLYDGERYRAGALHNVPEAFEEFWRRGPHPPSPESGLFRVAKNKQPAQIVDVKAEPGYASGDALIVAGADLAGIRSLVIVPMLKEEELIGAIGIYQQEVRPFSDKQIELVTNFAAQAVIAIENTRLLSELRESLQQQTATADVLKVISRSTFELQTVLDALVESAALLCEAEMASIARPNGPIFEQLASCGFPPELVRFMESHPLEVSRGTLTGRTVLEGRAIQIADVRADPEYKFVEAVGIGGQRTMLGVPLLREGVPIGVIVLARRAVRPFTDKQIALLETFADQAVIAIENVRLFDEVQKRTEELAESLQQQTATSDVLKVISRSTFDLQTVLDTLVASACQLCEADSGNISRPTSEGLFRFQAHHGMPPAMVKDLERRQIKAGRGTAIGRVLLERTPAHIEDVLNDRDYELVETSKLGGYRTLLAVPLLREGEPIGVFVLVRRVVRPFTERQIELVSTFADQAAIAIENVRLFDEIQDKSRQLAEASQHKSQFLASMSHELRTPLNAILGYTELIADGIYGAPPEKTQAVLKRVESNGRHLLGLINAVLDLSKIEAGQFTLDLADYSLQNVAQTVYNAVEPLALDKKLTFKADVQPDLPSGRGDERRLTQVLLNLVGNAIKFTDAGEVVIKAGAGNGSFELSVRDTGPGISAADQAKLFQEFQQAENPKTRKKEGTGLGLAISKRIIEMHGGRIWMSRSSDRARPSL